MAYYICHELWLYPKYIMCMLGFIYYMWYKCYFAWEGGMKYKLWVLICGNGGQGGEFNVQGESWVSRLGLGLS